MTVQVPLYNPRQDAPETLEKMLVGREDLLSEIFADLRRQAESKSRQHWLIRGPRGIGKTHVSGIIYHRLRNDSNLSKRFLPIWLTETAAYRVYSAGTLLREIANRLVRELEKIEDQAAGDLRKSLNEIVALGDDPVLFEELARLLKNESQRLGKIFLVLMENLDSILQSFPKARGNVESNRFRAFLTGEKNFLFLSTTPTHFLPKLFDPGSPLYAHFKERQLMPLTQEEIETLSGKLKELTGGKVGSGISVPESEMKLRNLVLHRLTGGSPRAAIMAFTVMSGTSGLKAMIHDFLALLDEQTPYFEARLATLAPRERVILSAMALAPANLTMKTIAQQTGLPGRSLSTLINRLVLEGLVSSAEKGKGALYQVVDGFFRLWYQYRQGIMIIPALIRFLALWHSAEELTLTLDYLKGSPQESDSFFEKQTRYATKLHVEEAFRYATSEPGRTEREGLWAECKLEVERTEKQPASGLLESIKEAVREMKPDLLRAAFLALRDRPLNRHEDALSPAAEARAAISVGACFVRLGMLENARSAFEHIIERFGESDNPEIQKEVAMAMANLTLTLGKAGRHEEAATGLRRLIESFGESDNPQIQEPVAWAMVNLAAAQWKSGQHEEAATGLRRMVERFGQSDNPQIQEQVATATWGLGVLLGELNRLNEAIDVLNRLLDFTMRHQVPKYHRLMMLSRIELIEIYVELRKRAEAVQQLTVWFDSLFDEKYSTQDHIDLVIRGLRFMTALCEPDLARAYFERLQSSTGEHLKEQLRFFGFVLDVLEAQQPIPVKGRHSTPAARRRKAVAHIPPELRTTILEAVDQVMQLRQKLR